MHAVALDDDDPALAAGRRDARRARRLRRQLRLQRDDELNLVSMIDVFAVLMFFLLVTASISAARLKVLALDLPATSALAALPPPARPMVELRRDALRVDPGDGRLRRLARHGDEARLAALLLEAKRRAPAQDAIELRVAADVAYAEVVALIDQLRASTPAARAAGFPGELFPKLAVGAARAR